LRLAQRWVRAVGHALLPRHEVERIASAQRSDAGHGYDAFGMHRDWLVLARALLGPLYGRYFRVSSFGSEHIPRDGPAILIANHAGTLPIDAAMICLDVAEHTQPPRMPRIVVDRFVPRMPVFGSLASRVGAVSGTPGNVRHLLENGELCLIFPEGLPAIGKPVRERYVLREFRVGYAEIALRMRVPILPVAVIGSEEQWPQLGRLPIPMLGAPYLPIVATPLPLPVHYRIHYGPVLEPFTGMPEGEVTSEAAAAANRDAKAAVERLIARGLAERKGVFR
jgi:1-acyl-sn-glycerol-3-phosphate acyltransferase